jgi:hypothetical protein
MAMATSTFSPHPLPLKTQLGSKPHRLHLAPLPRLRAHRRLAAAAGEAPVEVPPKPADPSASNGSAASVAAPVAAAKVKVEAEVVASPKFQDSRWVNGTWDLSRFGSTGGTVDWDAVIDAGETTNRRVAVGSKLSILVAFHPDPDGELDGIARSTIE